MKRPSTRKGRPYATLAVLAAAFAVAVPLFLTAPGCGLQAEGQRCSRETSATHDGSEDCGTDLVCTQVIGASSDICCPKSGVSDNANCQAQVAASTSSGVTSSSASSSSSSSSSATSSASSSASSSATSSTSTGTGAGGSTTSSTSAGTGTGAGGAGGGV